MIIYHALKQLRPYLWNAQYTTYTDHKPLCFQWTSEHHRAFELLKQALTSDAVMAHPRCNQEYKLFTDACDYAIGAILCQTDDLGVERPVVYLSKQLSSCQRRWPVIEKDAYTVKFDKFYLGVQISVYTVVALELLCHLLSVSFCGCGPHECCFGWLHECFSYVQYLSAHLCDLDSLEPAY